MTSPRVRFVLAASGLAAALILAGPRAAFGSSPHPNIILFVSDDHGVADSGAYGDTVVRTPNIDALARQGMRFTRAFAASPLCSPSRCAIATGMMPFRNGGHKFGTPIRPGLRTMPAYFNDLGYFTAHFGKFHHGPRKQFPYDKTDPNESQAAEFLAAYDEEQPLLLVVCSHPPHTPWEKNAAYDPAKLTLPPSFVETPETRTDRADYYTDVTLMDAILGDVLAASRQRQIDNETLFVYTTDQGANWPFAKWCLYDAGIQVPFIARWPGIVEAGCVSNAMVSLVDLLPTLLDVAGGETPSRIDGRSFLDVLVGRQDSHRDAIFAAHTGNDNGGPGIANHCPMRCVRTPTHKYIVNLHPDRTFYTHIVGCKSGNAHHLPFWESWVEKAESDADARRIVDAYLHRPAEELYDLTCDPFEMHNLASDPAHTKSLESLRRRLTQWRRQQDDPELSTRSTGTHHEP